MNIYNHWQCNNAPLSPLVIITLYSLNFLLYVVQCLHGIHHVVCNVVYIDALILLYCFIFTVTYAQMHTQIFLFIGSSLIHLWKYRIASYVTNVYV